MDFAGFLIGAAGYVVGSGGWSHREKRLHEPSLSPIAPCVTLDHRRIKLNVRPGSSVAKREAVIHEWHKSLLHDAIPRLIKTWEPKLGVKVSGYFVQRMKTQWGGCNPSTHNIRLNTELVKKPKDLLEYVVVHEMAHLITSSHSESFVDALDSHYPTWREARMELNALPLSAGVSRSL